MKPNGYKVEFILFERRLLERRFIDSLSGLFDLERRVSERREITDVALDDQASFDRKQQRTLTH